MNFSKSEDNVFRTLRFLFKTLKVNSTDRELKRKLIKNPDFPSLACFPSLLSAYDIECAPIKLNISKISEIPLPSIAHIESFEGSYFIIITKIFEGKVTYFLNESEVKETIYDFIRKWNGILILVKTKSNATHRKYTIENFLSRNKIILQSIFIAFVCFSVVLAIVNSNAYPYPTLSHVLYLCLLKTVGLVSCAYLYRKYYSSLELRFGFIEHLHAYRKNVGYKLQSAYVNCNKLIFYFIFCYFLTTIFVVLLSKDYLLILRILNYVALCFISIFLIAHSLFKLKLFHNLYMILSLVIVESIILNQYLYSTVIGNLVLQVSIILSITILAIQFIDLFISYTFQEKSNSNFIKNQLNLEQVSLLLSQENFDTFLESTQGIIVGSPEASIVVQLIISVDDYNSIKVLKRLFLLSKKYDTFKVKVIPTVVFKNASASLASLILLSLQNEMAVEEISNLIYGITDIRALEQKKAMITDAGILRFNSNLEIMYENEIHKLPAIYINNIDLDPSYAVDDVPLICETLSKITDL